MTVNVIASLYQANHALPIKSLTMQVKERTKHSKGGCVVHAAIQGVYGQDVQPVVGAQHSGAQAAARVDGRARSIGEAHHCLQRITLQAAHTEPTADLLACIQKIMFVLDLKS